MAELTRERLIEWDRAERDAGRYPEYRIVSGGAPFAGSLAVQHNGGRLMVALRGSKAYKHGVRRQSFYDRHLAPGAYPRLEIKVGARYRPACEVIDR